MNDKYRNPDPPPGYVRRQSPLIQQSKCLMVNGVKCNFIHLIKDLDIFNTECEYQNLSSSDQDEDICHSDDEITMVEEIAVRDDVFCTSEVYSSQKGKRLHKDSLYSSREKKKQSYVLESSDSDSEKLYRKKHCSSPPAEKKVQNGYSPVPEEIIRKKIRAESFIQNTVESNKFPPCPGLEHVTEIRGIKETSYYCSLCDAHCSINSIKHHLRGYKHMLQCLKLFKPHAYDRFKNQPKFIVYSEVIEILSYIQNKEGIGNIVVEKEYKKNDFEYPRNDIISQGCNTPGTSFDEPSLSFQGVYSTTIPDTSKDDYYCRICESRMNSCDMWQSHVGSKDYYTNVRKIPMGDVSKPMSVPAPNANAFLLDRVKGVKEHGVDLTILGLDHIREIQNMEIHKETYHCYLCHSCLTSMNIIDHITSQKHRIQYLEHINHCSLDIVRGMDLQDNNSYYYIEEICKNVEIGMGSGCPEVYQTKS